MRMVPVIGLLCAFLLIKFAANPELLEEPLIVGNTFSDDRGSGGVFEIGTVIGELIVFLFYWFKFNEWAGEGNAPAGFRPRPARHFTTWLTYLGWNSFYGLLMVGAYSLIVFFPDLIYRLLDTWAVASNSLNVPVPGVPEARGFLATIFAVNDAGVHTSTEPAQLAPYAVLLTTVVWAGMRPFSEFERRFRLRLQEQAAIPTQAKQLVETFERERSTFEPDDETVTEVVERLEARPLRCEDFTAPEKSIRFRYARVEYLNYLLLKYNRSPVFSRLAERYSEDLRDLDTQLSRVRKRVAQRIEDIHESMREKDSTTPPPSLLLTEQWLDDNVTTLGRAQRRNLNRQYEELEAEVDSVWHDLIQVVVCSVLAVGRSPVRRKELLAAFGLKQPGQLAIPLDPVTITWIAVVTLITVFLSSALYFWVIGTQEHVASTVVPRNLDEVLWWSVIACMMHLLATIGGYAIQRSLGEQRERWRVGKACPLPRRAQLAEAIWAAVFGFSLNVLLFALLTATGGEFGKLAQYWWWALVPAVTAFFTAIHTQRVERPQRVRTQLVWMQSGFTSLMALMVFVLIHSHSLWPETRFVVVIYGVYVVVTSLVVGLALAITMRDWVTVERYMGVNDRRHAKRHKARVTACWQSDSEELTMDTVRLSDTGAELKCGNRPLTDRTGVLTLPEGKQYRAQVVRQERKRCFVKFLDQLAGTDAVTVIETG